MKVLVAHNRYVSSQPSGENQVVDAEIALLQQAGVEVVTQLESSDELIDAGRLGLLRAGLGPVYAPEGVARFRQLLTSERPDIVHLHNANPLISPWVIRLAHAAGIPVVHTVHNYRHSCVQGLHFRAGRTCVDCVDHGPLSAVRNGCYQGSRARTVPMVIGQVVHRGTWQLVSRFLALTPFMAASLMGAGVPADRITLRPSWVPDPGPTRPPGDDVLFVGRLDEAKGVELLLDAWAVLGGEPGRRLCIAGDGPLRSRVEAAAAAAPDSIRYEGYVDSDRVRQLMDAAAVVVVPSLWFEGYPLVIAQAFGHGRPVVAIRGGSAGSIVDQTVGWLADPTSSALASVLAGLTEVAIVDRGRCARSRYQADNAPDAASASLLAVYHALLEDFARQAVAGGVRR